MARDLNPTKSEGFIVRDSKFRRVKVKSPQYVALHLLAAFNNQSTAKPWRQIIKVIQSNERDEFLAYYPQWESLYNEVKKLYQDLSDDLAVHYEQFDTLDKEHKYYDILSKVDENTSIKDVMSKMDAFEIDKLIPDPDWTPPRMDVKRDNKTYKKQKQLLSKVKDIDESINNATRSNRDEIFGSIMPIFEGKEIDDYHNESILEACDDMLNNALKSKMFTKKQKNQLRNYLDIVFGYGSTDDSIVELHYANNRRR